MSTERHENHFNSKMELCKWQIHPKHTKTDKRFAAFGFYNSWKYFLGFHAFKAWKSMETYSDIL